MSAILEQVDHEDFFRGCIVIEVVWGVEGSKKFVCGEWRKATVDADLGMSCSGIFRRCRGSSWGCAPYIVSSFREVLRKFCDIFAS